LKNINGGIKGGLRRAASFSNIQIKEEEDEEEEDDDAL
jgi:hypothetical protein